MLFQTMSLRKAARVASGAGQSYQNMNNHTGCRLGSKKKPVIVHSHV